MINNIILATSNILKKNIIKNSGYKVYLRLPPIISKIPFIKEKPDNFINRLINYKSISLSKQFPHNIIITNETILTRGKIIFSKPKNLNELKTLFQILSGKRHTIYNTIYIIYNNLIYKRKVKTSVKLKLLNKKEISFLIDYHKKFQKIGGYYLESSIINYIIKTNGLINNLMTKSLYEIHKVLYKLGIRQYLINII